MEIRTENVPKLVTMWTPLQHMSALFCSYSIVVYDAHIFVKGSNALFSFKAEYTVGNSFLICVLNGEKAIRPYNDRTISLKNVSHTMKDI